MEPICIIAVDLRIKDDVPTAVAVLSLGLDITGKKSAHLELYTEISGPVIEVQAVVNRLREQYRTDWVITDSPYGQAFGWEFFWISGPVTKTKLISHADRLGVEIENCKIAAGMGYSVLTNRFNLP